jgi:hypothetical protein
MKKGELYNDLHPETSTKNTGYKNSTTALNTLKIIKYRSLRYQFDVVNAMYNRAKYHRNQTKDMKKAMKIFSRWLKRYKKLREEERRKYKWIDYEIYKGYRKYIEEYKLEGYRDIYEKIRETKGKYYKLQYIKKDDKYDYYSYRINFIKKNRNKIMFKNNKPTKIYIKLLLFCYDNKI